jgi:hypothetical protein
MLRSVTISLVAILLLACTTGRAQGYDQDEVAANTGIVFHTDPRLAVLIKKHKNVQLGVIRSGRGYRVQIYNGADRSKATSVKLDFMRRFPGVRTYLTYISPAYRIKVGDFRSRGDAERMYQQVNSIYNPCMIVPDIIVINTLKDD